MSFLDKVKERNQNKDSVFGNTATINGHQYDRYVLEEKVRNNKLMTDEEHRALEKFKQKELSNQIARVVGVVSIVAIIILAIGCFLYPFSIFNLFGNGDRFWDCWDHMSYHVSSSDMQHFAEKVNLFSQNEDYVKAWCDARGATYTITSWAEGTGTVSGGWLNLSEIMRMAFEDGTSFKVSFVTIGAWSIIVLSTIGFVAAIFISIYMLAYNISDLFKLVHRGAARTKENLHDVKDAIVSGVTGRDDEKTITITQPAVKKPARKKTAKKIEDTVKKPEVTEVEKTDEEVEEDEINAKIEAIKADIAANDEKIYNQEPATEAVTSTEDIVPEVQPRRNAKDAEPDYDNLSEDELNAMLSK